MREILEIWCKLVQIKDLNVKQPEAGRAEFLKNNLKALSSYIFARIHHNPVL